MFSVSCSISVSSWQSPALCPLQRPYTARILKPRWPTSTKRARTPSHLHMQVQKGAGVADELARLIVDHLDPENERQFNSISARLEIGTAKQACQPNMYPATLQTHNAHIPTHSPRHLTLGWRRTPSSECRQKDTFWQRSVCIACIGSAGKECNPHPRKICAWQGVERGTRYARVRDVVLVHKIKYSRTRPLRSLRPHRHSWQNSSRSR